MKTIYLKSVIFALLLYVSTELFNKFIFKANESGVTGLITKLSGRGEFFVFATDNQGHSVSDLIIRVKTSSSTETIITNPEGIGYMKLTETDISEINVMNKTLFSRIDALPIDASCGIFLRLELLDVDSANSNSPIHNKEGSNELRSK